MEVKKQKLIRESSEFSFIKYIGNQLNIRNWTLNGLPQDSFSISNAIIMEYSDNYPLFIDP